MKAINLKTEKINLESVKIALERDEMLEISGGCSWGNAACGFAAGAAIGAFFFPPYGIVAAGAGLACYIGSR